MLMVRELGPGGTERQAATIARWLDRGRFMPHVACFHEGFRTEELRSAGVPVVRLPVQSFLSASALQGAWILRRYLRQHRIRLVHSFDYPMNCFGVPVARLAGTPVVVSSQRGSRELNPPLYNHMLRVTDRLVDAVVANCEAMRRHLVEDEGVPSERVRVCLNGLDTATFHPGSRARTPALADASLVIGVISVLRPEKGLATLVEAFAQVLDRQPGIRLAIVGSGPELSRLQQMAERLGIADACVFEPAKADVASVLRSIDIFVLPSLSEALSNSLMEAMACGCAAVASAIGGNPELIVDGETGLLFECGNTAALAAQLRRLIDDADLRGRLACAGSSRMAAEFSVTTAVARVERLYESLLG